MSERVQFKNSGVSPKTLIELVENTAPFVFNEDFVKSNAQLSTRYLHVLNSARARSSEIEQDLASYYELCIAAHFATVGTFVPTDVDQAIRFKLWKNVHHEAAFEKLYALVKEFRAWDEAPVSRRWAGDKSQRLSGHQGEWFSIAVGAYATSLKVAHSATAEIRELIEAEVARHETVLTQMRADFSEAHDVSTMKTFFGGIAAVAHNLGDLDRMIEMWELPETDVLKRRVFRLGHEDARKPVPVFFETGAFYQKQLASENHRHLALREAKPLRKNDKYLIPFGPFYDDWGAMLVKEGYLTGDFNEREFREIVEALINGWKKLNQQNIYHTQGYARALAGIQNALPKGRGELEALLPPRLLKEITEGGLRTHLSVSKKQFEDQWLKKGLKI